MNPLLPLVHGHRGCRGLRPENTVAAFLHAVRLGVDVLELDVVVSADAQVVVSHEPWPSALYCSGPNGQPIRPEEERAHNFYRLPYATIQSFDCGQRRHPGFPEQQPMPATKPLLADVIRAVAQCAQQLGRPSPALSIEVKSTPAGDDIFHPAPARFTELVLAVLHSTRAFARTTLLSFDERILQVARAVSPELRLCLLTEEPYSPPHLFDSLGFIPNVWGPDYQLLTHDLVQEAHAAYPQLELVPWTVNELIDMRQVISWQVAGITTDYPDRLLTLLQSNAAEKG